MKTIFIFCATAVAVALAAIPHAPASAADLAVPAIDDWGGFRVGAFGGVSFLGDRRTDLSSDVTGGFGPFRDAYSAAGLVGVSAGFDVVSTPWLFGVTADLGLGFSADRKSRSAGVVSLDMEAERKASLSVAARVGHIFGRSLVYGLGGVEIAKLGYDVRARDTVLSARLDDDFWKAGLTLGAGVETRLTSSLSVDFGYRNSRFGARAIRGAVVDAGGAPTGETLRTKARLDAHTARIGLNYRF